MKTVYFGKYREFFVDLREFCENPAEGWVHGGAIILARETKIAEMRFSDPYETAFQLKKINSAEVFIFGRKFT